MAHVTANPQSWDKLRNVNGILNNEEGYPLFRKEKRLGKGKYGTVWVYTHLPTRQKIAIKMIKKADTTIELVKKEFVMGAKLRHPNVGRIFGGYQTPTLYFLIMEYLDGGTLKGALTDAGMEAGLACNYFLQILDGLEHMHKNDVLHFDVKPDNVMIVGNGCVKLIDFGLSQYMEGAVTRVRASLSSYMSPEAQLDGAQGPPTDIFGLGIMLYRLLLARKPFEKPSDREQAELMFSAGPETSFETWDALPSNAKELILSMLKRNPAERPTPDQIRQSDWVLANKASADSVPAVPAAAMEYITAEAVKMELATRAADFCLLPVARVADDLTKGKNTEACMNYHIMVCQEAAKIH